MAPLVRWLPAFLLLLSFPSLGAAETRQGRVTKVFDGDTILVRVQGKEEVVRLREIDAPERAGRNRPGQEPWGKKAREFALSRLKDRRAQIETVDRDERDAYGRLLAYVFAGSTFLNREMVRSGNAFLYRPAIGGRYLAQLEEAEEKARSQGVGVWDRQNGLKESPRDFRARTKQEEGIFSSRERSSGKDGDRRSLQAEAVPGNKIVGNQRSGVYHLPDSPSAAKVSPKNRVYFDSPEEAEKAGFRRSGSLPPGGGPPAPHKSF